MKRTGDQPESLLGSDQRNNRKCRKLYRLLFECLKKAIDLPIRPCISLYLDLTIQLRSLFAPLFPSFENVGGIGIEKASPFAPAYTPGTTSTIIPILDRPCGYSESSSYFILRDAEFLQLDHILKALLI